MRQKTARDNFTASAVTALTQRVKALPENAKEAEGMRRLLRYVRKSPRFDARLSFLSFLWRGRVHRDAGGLFTNEKDALMRFSEIASPLTDETGREHAAIMVSAAGADGSRICFFSSVCQGKPLNVVGITLFAVLGTLLGRKKRRKQGVEFSVLHTHPQTAWQDIKTGDLLFPKNTGEAFSGIPEAFRRTAKGRYRVNWRWWLNNRKTAGFALGDTTVATFLGFDHIYMISPHGNAYKYSGFGNERTDPYHSDRRSDIETMWADKDEKKFLIGGGFVSQCNWYDQKGKRVDLPGAGR